MNNQSSEFNINTYIKEGSDLIVELDDEVEYLLDDAAIASLKNNESIVILRRLIDSEKKIIATERVIKTLQSDDSIDYLEKK